MRDTLLENGGKKAETSARQVLQSYGGRPIRLRRTMTLGRSPQESGPDKRALQVCEVKGLETGRVYLNYPGSPDTISRVCVRGEQTVRAGEKTRRCWSQRPQGSRLSPGRPAASTPERQGTALRRSLRKEAPHRHRGCKPVRLISDWTPPEM